MKEERGGRSDEEEDKGERERKGDKTSVSILLLDKSIHTLQSHFTL